MPNQRNVIKALAPIPLYFLIGWMITLGLGKYTIVGPVDHEMGEPIFSDYSAMVHSGFLLLIIIGVIYSIFHVVKITGWLRYLTFIIIICAIPLEYAYAIALQIVLFGK